MSAQKAAFITTELTTSPQRHIMVDVGGAFPLSNKGSRRPDSVSSASSSSNVLFMRMFRRSTNRVSSSEFLHAFLLGLVFHQIWNDELLLLLTPGMFWSYSKQLVSQHCPYDVLIFLDNYFERCDSFLHAVIQSPGWYTAL